MFALVKRLVQLLPGFLLIAVVIWVGGPFVVIGDWRPLETESARLLAIVGIVVCWLAWVLVARWRARRASSAMAAALVQQPAAAEPAPPADVVKLRESFEQAADTLSKRGRGATLYDLPWYVFIGAPGSGKTTALLNSGLDFFLEQGGGQARLRGVGGTRNCDWWFTDEAVFLDTAGRFTTQDSDAASDSTGWKEFLALLTTYRKRRPINGVILTISAKDLLTQGDAAREQQVEAARVRLRELGRELQIQLPVYVMVTMCDLVAGFTEYFDDLSQAGRAQVWGVTFPYDLTTSGQAAGTFPAEFDGLVTRLNERVVSRLEEETDTRRRIRLFAFPQQMAAMRDGLAQFVTDVFTGTKYEQQILLRGVYFTSGTQEGTPIDRLIGAVGRGFRMASDAVAAPAGRGKAYFVETLLKDVLIGESGLAGVNRSLEMRKAAGQLALYGGLALVVLLGVMVLSVSYRRNGTYVADVQRDVTRLQAVPPARAASAVTTLLPRLDALRRVVDSANRYNTTSIPLGMRWGLYQGTSLGNAARDAYLLELDASMLPFLAARLRQRVIQYGNEPDKLYEYLKAYLMLESPERLNKQHLLFLAGLEWTPTAGVSADASASVTRHVQALIDREGALRPVAIDAALVRQACATIREASLGRIMYGWLKQQYASSDAHAIRLDVAAGSGPGALIRRRSGVSLAQPVSGLYSKAAFQEITSKSGDELVEQFAADNWVCQRSGDLGDRSRLKADLTNIYQQDYADNWDAVLDDLVVAPEAFGTVAATAQSLGVLTGPTSPIRNVLRLVNDNTQLVEAPKAAEAESAMTSTAKAAASRLTDMFRARTGAAPPAATAGALVTARFQHIHQLFAGEPGAAPIDQVLARLRDLEQQFRALGPEVGQRPPGDFLKDPLFRQNLGALQQSAATLPPSIKKWIDVIDSGAGGAVRAGT
ncbi:MAG TPA: type VI secretion system membrane subunit TssM, partial [Luteitalea sp.]|nr:type VI secretion system membrane subunit TssM [Luteitalea sp.]